MLAHQGPPKLFGLFNDICIVRTKRSPNASLQAFMELVGHGAKEEAESEVDL